MNTETQEQKNFNKEALKILETKKAQRTIEEQSMRIPLCLPISLKLILSSTMKYTLGSIRERETAIFPIHLRSLKHFLIVTLYHRLILRKTLVRGLEDIFR